MQCPHAPERTTPEDATSTAAARPRCDNNNSTQHAGSALAMVAPRLSSAWHLSLVVVHQQGQPRPLIRPHQAVKISSTSGVSPHSSWLHAHTNTWYLVPGLNWLEERVVYVKR